MDVDTEGEKMIPTWQVRIESGWGVNTGPRVGRNVWTDGSCFLFRSVE